MFRRRLLLMMPVLGAWWLAMPGAVAQERRWYEPAARALSHNYALGATMTDFAGWDMPLRYGSEREEHLAVRTKAGLFDLSHMGEITVSGPQAGELLDHALVGFISALGVLRARYTMICAEDGGILEASISQYLQTKLTGG